MKKTPTTKSKIKLKKPIVNTKNTNKLSSAYKLLLNHPFKLLTFILASSTVVGGIISKISSRKQSEDQLVRCGSNLEAFVPITSIAYPTVKFHLDNNCQGVGNVPLIFTKINAYAYATDYCAFFNKALKQCSNMPGEIHSPQVAKQKKLSPNLTNVVIVQEGEYTIVNSKQTAATGGISYCVGLTITSPNSSEVLLAHINAENIFANDDYLKGKFIDPFIAIKDFVINKKLDWKITLVSGSYANLVYIKTLLEHIGLHNIDSYCEPGWVITHSSKVNHGSIIIQEGQPFIIENPQDFKGLFVTIPKEKKEKPGSFKVKIKFTNLGNMPSISFRILKLTRLSFYGISSLTIWSIYHKCYSLWRAHS